MGLLLILIVLGFGGFLLYRFNRGNGPDTLFGSQRSAIDIAKERYARGEISKEEFERITDDLI